MFDILIEGGEVLDGTGRPAERADVGVREGRIVEVGKLAGSQAGRRIRAEGHIVCPGFIDMHSHDDFNLPVNPLCSEKTQQGVTTQVTGNCGFSPAPIVDERRDLFVKFVSFADTGLRFEWSSFGEFIDRMPPLGLNVAQLVGHIPVRIAAMGVEDRPPTAQELARMQALVAEAMEAGAVGFSTGLMYPPSSYADTDEIVALTEVAGRYGGGYHSHVRDMGVRVFDAVEEAVEVGRRAGTRVQVSHMKINNRRNWGRAEELMALVERARREGHEVLCDAYPYTAGSGGLKNASLPKWAQAGGVDDLLGRLRDPGVRARLRAEILEKQAAGTFHIGAWDTVVIAESAHNPQFVGRNLQQIATLENKAPVDAFLDLILSDEGHTLSVHFMMQEEDVRVFLKHPALVIGSDGIFKGREGGKDPGQPHPRHFGTFPRILGHYCREEHLLDLPTAVQKMTSLSADQLRLRDRGRVQPGAIADLCVFNPATVGDTATYEDPQRAPTGIEAVLVSGEPVVQGGQPTGAAPGRVLRRAKG